MTEHKRKRKIEEAYKWPSDQKFQFRGRFKSYKYAIISTAANDEHKHRIISRHITYQGAKDRVIKDHKNIETIDIVPYFKEKDQNGFLIA